MEPKNFIIPSSFQNSARVRAWGWPANFSAHVKEVPFCRGTTKQRKDHWIGKEKPWFKGKSPFLMGKSTISMVTGLVFLGNFTGNPWVFNHQIHRAFRLKFSHNPILWKELLTNLTGPSSEKSQDEIQASYACCIAIDSNKAYGMTLPAASPSSSVHFLRTQECNSQKMARFSNVVKHASNGWNSNLGAIAISYVFEEIRIWL